MMTMMMMMMMVMVQIKMTRNLYNMYAILQTKLGVLMMANDTDDIMIMMMIVYCKKQRL